MSKRSISLITVVLLVLTALVALFALRLAGRDRRGAPIRQPISALTSPMDAGIAAEQPAPSAAPIILELGPRIAPERDGGARLDEATLLSRLHDLAASDPPRSLALAREAAARFPDSSNAPEFEWNIVKALANMDRYLEAETEARRMLHKFPGNAFADDVERHLLNHPPNPPSVPDR